MRTDPAPDGSGALAAPGGSALDRSLRGRAMGALIGLAVGDALGTTLEFTTRDSHPLHTEMTGGGPFRLPPGVWTDDTSMALALADSLTAKGGLDEHDLMTRFVRWWREGAYSATGACFDIGTTTSAALAKFERTGDPIAGDTNLHSAGNGSLMRLSPVAIYHRNAPEKAIDAARRQSATTHAAPECLASCAFYAGLLVRAINGEPKDQLLAPSGMARGRRGGRDRGRKLAIQGAPPNPVQRLRNPQPGGGALGCLRGAEFRGSGGDRRDPRRRF